MLLQPIGTHQNGRQPAAAAAAVRFSKQEVVKPRSPALRRRPEAIKQVPDRVQVPAPARLYIRGAVNIRSAYDRTVP